MIVAADGAKSSISRKIGLVTSKTNTIWSRSFVKPDTHKFIADFAIFHPPELSPGFFIITREVEDYLSLCCYVMPGGKITPDQLPEIHKQIIENNEQVKNTLGDNIVMTEIQCSHVRVGGVHKYYCDQFVVVGSAAGHLDPLNGQGIQYAIIGANLAAKTIKEGFERGDLSSYQLQKYQTRVDKAFGWDLWMSSFLAKILYYFPKILDATASMIKRNGKGPLKLWLAARSGRGSKFQFIRPDIIFMIFVEFIYQSIKCKIKSILSL